jgi:hypothetical protein
LDGSNAQKVEAQVRQTPKGKNTILNDVEAEIRQRRNARLHKKKREEIEQDFQEQKAS